MNLTTRMYLHLCCAFSSYVPKCNRMSNSPTGRRNVFLSCPVRLYSTWKPPSRAPSVALRNGHGTRRARPPNPYALPKGDKACQLVLRRNKKNYCTWNVKLQVENKSLLVIPFIISDLRGLRSGHNKIEDMFSASIYCHFLSGESVVLCSSRCAT
jgi:hypothetical protein